MAILNGKFTAFDPTINLNGVEDDDETLVVNASIQGFSGSGVSLFQMDRTQQEIEEAMEEEMTIFFVIAP